MKDKKITTVPVDERLEGILICAERYCLGRSTYVVKDFCDYVRPLLPRLSDKTLYVLNQDFLSNSKRADGGSWGMDIDKNTWGNFWNDVLNEIQIRTTKGTWQKEG